MKGEGGPEGGEEKEEAGGDAAQPAEATVIHCELMLNAVRRCMAHCIHRDNPSVAGFDVPAHMVPYQW